MSDKQNDLHTNHRKRTLAKFSKQGAEVFYDHQLLEMLLFFCIPRKDTNPIAHKLLNKFGSLERMLYAPIEKLKEVDGIGERSAQLISLSAAIARNAEVKAASAYPLDSDFRRRRYISSWYHARPAGTVAITLLDYKYRIIETVALSEGRTVRPEEYAYPISKAVNETGASYALLSHNHEDGVRYPSVEDVYLTCSIERSLSLRECHLLEHYIVCDGDVIAVSEKAPSVKKDFD